MPEDAWDCPLYHHHAFTGQPVRLEINQTKHVIIRVVVLWIPYRETCCRSLPVQITSEASAPLVPPAAMHYQPQSLGSILPFETHELSLGRCHPASFDPIYVTIYQSTTDRHWNIRTLSERRATPEHVSRAIFCRLMAEITRADGND